MGQLTKSPRVGCAVIVRDSEGRVILGRRAKQPFFGAWVLPGGGVKAFESYSDTAKREAKEELGIDIVVESLHQVAEIINPPDEHRIVLYVNCRALGGELRPSSDISEARYFSKDQVGVLLNDGLTTPTVSPILRAIFALEGAACPQSIAQSVAA